MTVSLQIQNLAKRTPAIRRAFLRNAKEKILGKKYELSLVFIGDALSRRLNRERRGKDKPANTLSFPLTETSGEIFINMAQAKRDAPRFGEGTAAFALRLFIHSLLHLKGFSHGSTMESEEEKYIAFLRRSA